MISNLFKTGLSSLEAISIIPSLQSNHNQKSTPQISKELQVEQIVEDTLLLLTQILSQKLDQNIGAEELKELATEVLASKRMETSLLQTKQKYNDLINKSGMLYQQARKISHSVGEFVSNINLFLESEELLVPLNDIQKAIGELNSERVERQFNYLIKIFTNNFQEVIDKNVQIVEKNMEQEIKVVNNLNKNIESQLLGIRSGKNNDESKFLDQAMRVTSLNEKVSKLMAQRNDFESELKVTTRSLQESMRTINDQETEIVKIKSRQAELLERIKKSDIKSIRVEKQVKQRGNQAEQLTSIIEKLKHRQEEMAEELESQHKRKQMQRQSMFKKICNEKAVLEQRLEGCNDKIVLLEDSLQTKTEENQRFVSQLDRFKTRNMMEIDLDQIEGKEQSQPKKENETEIGNDSNKTKEPLQSKEEKTDNIGPKPKMTLEQLISKLSILELKNTEIKGLLAIQKQNSVNKQVMKGLFISYDDESKEWSIRRNIKYQIYSLLDMQHKLPKPEEPKQGKWFGLF